MVARRRKLESPEATTEEIRSASVGVNEGDSRSAHETRQRYDRLFEDSPEAIFIAKPDGTIVDVNQAAVRLLDFPSKDDFLSVDASSLYDNPDDRQVLMEMLSSRGAVQNYELQLRSRSGRLLTVLETSTAERDSSGQIRSILGFLRDVTEQRELEQRLLQAQKMEAIGRLAGGVAHDFNNMLTTIIGYTDLARLTSRDGDSIDGDLEQIREAADRAATLTRQLLAFSRQQVLQPRVIDLNKVVTGFIKLLQRTIGEEITLLTELEPQLAKVKADPGQIEQVLMNLVINSKDAMPEGGTIMIETTHVELDEAFAARHVTVQPGPHVMLAVSDNGTGMDEETQSRVFEPFFTTKEAGKGTGLGLATAYGIIKQSGGSIWVYSELGQGTTIKIYLPTVDLEEDGVVRPADAIPVGACTETLLVVDNDEALRRLVTTVLSAQGFRVLDASDGKTALELFEENQEAIELVLTDFVMPEMDGMELANRVKQLRPDIRVLFMSGHTKRAVLKAEPLEPGQLFIDKPFDAEKLIRSIRSALDQESEEP